MPGYFSRLIQHSGIQIPAKPRAESPSPSSQPRNLAGILPAPSTVSSSMVEGIAQEVFVDAVPPALSAFAASSPAGKAKQPNMTDRTTASDQAAAVPDEGRNDVPKHISIEWTQPAEAEDISLSGPRPKAIPHGQEENQDRTAQSTFILDHTPKASIKAEAGYTPDSNSTLRSRTTQTPSAHPEQPIGSISDRPPHTEFASKSAIQKAEEVQIGNRKKPESIHAVQESTSAPAALRSAPIYLRDVLAWVRETPAPDERDKSIAPESSTSLEQLSSPAAAQAPKPVPSLISEQDYTVSIGSIHLIVDATPASAPPVQSEPRRSVKPPRTDLDFLKWHRHYLRIR